MCYTILARIYLSTRLVRTFVSVAFLIIGPLAAGSANQGISVDLNISCQAMRLGNTSL
jgi:hypothetical protein